MADRSITVKLRAEVSSYMASLRRAAQATDAFARNVDKTTARSARNVASQRGAFQAAGQQLGDGVSRGFTRGARGMGRETERVAKRANRQFSALATTIVASLPAASSAAIGAATVAAGASFAALGAFALRNNADIVNSFKLLGRTVSSDLAADASVLEVSFTNAADNIGEGFQNLRPLMQRAFLASRPLVDSLADGVIDFAQNAMPGMVMSVERAGPVFDGFRSLLGSTGQGLGDFFEIVSEGSEDTGEGLENLGSLIEDTLTGVAPILGDLNSLWAEHGAQVSEVISELLGVLGGLTSSALPVFSTAVGVALDVLSGLLGVIKPMVDILGPAIGTWLSLAAAMKAIGAVRGILGNVSTSVVDFGTNLRDAGKRGRAFKVGAVGVALAIGAIASQASALNPDLDAMVQGLKRWAKTGETSGEAARVLGTDFENLGYMVDVMNAGWDKAVGKAIEFVPALVGIKGPIAEAEEQIKSLDGALAQMVQSGNQEQAARIVQEIAKQTGTSVAEVKAGLTQYNAAVEISAERTQSLGTTAMQSQPGIEALEESLSVLADKTADTADKVDALNDAWRRLFGISIPLEEAVGNFEGGLDEIRESLKGVQEETANWQGRLLNANGTVNLATEEGQQLSRQLIAQGDDYRTLAQTAYDTAIRQGKSQKEAAAVAVSATNQRRRQFVREMVQMGFNDNQARALANRYFGLPEDVSTLILQPGMGTAIANMRQYLDRVNAIPENVSTTVTTIFTSIGTGPTKANQALSSTSYPYRDGGLVAGYDDGGMVRGPGGPRADIIPALLSNGEFVVNAKATDRFLPLLQAINSNSVRGMADGGSTVRQSAFSTAVRGAPMSTTVVQNNTITVSGAGNPSQVVHTIRKEIKNFGGDVQKALGGR